jgi:hypothetical protein
MVLRAVVTTSASSATISDATEVRASTQPLEVFAVMVVQTPAAIEIER